MMVGLHRGLVAYAQVDDDVEGAEPVRLPGRRIALRVAGVLAALLLACAVVARLSLGKAAGRWPGASAGAAAAPAALSLAAMLGCPPSEEGVLFGADKNLQFLRGSTSADTCQVLCFRNRRCSVWVWSREQRICLLKQLRSPTARPTRREVPGLVSGFSCRTAEEGWANGLRVSAAQATEATAFTVGDSTAAVAPVDGAPWAEPEPEPKGKRRPQPQPPPDPALEPEPEPGTSQIPAGPLGATLFCWALMRPGSGEEALLSLQYDRGWSIFGCEDVAVYSNQVIAIGAGSHFYTSMVNHSLDCQVGGDFGTALNTDIFMAVWDEVFRGGRYLLRDWTVKADPDTVFLPTRLRVELVRHPETPEGAYLDNCKYGLHGPAEVLSQNAVQAFAGGKQQCVDRLTQLCSGPCPFGEDMFLDKCLGALLGVRRDRAFTIMSEEHCDSPEWSTCADAAAVAFHPFKTPDSYEACVRNAEAVDETAPVATAK